MRLGDLLHNSLPVVIYGTPDVDIASLAYDSRRVAGRTDSGGTLFFALKGIVDDGLRYVRDAVEKGAVAVTTDRDADDRPPGTTFVKVADARRAMAEVADIFHRSPSRELSIAAVTGTNGKTTTTYMLDSIFTAAGLRSGVVGTIQYRLGNMQRPAARTTPESVDLQAMLRESLDAGITHIAMEVSSHSLEMKRVHSVRFSTAVFTNLTQDHLDFHQDMDAYLRAKLKLFETLDAGAHAVVNRDSPQYSAVAASTRSNVISYGMEHGADVTIEYTRLNMDGFKGKARTPWGKIELASPMVGRFNVYNALAALTAACSAGVPLDAAAEGIRRMSHVPGRVERIELGAFSAVIDYAHSPDALENLLSSLRPLTPGRLIAIFGCGGDRDRRKRPLMAAAVARHADLAVLTSDNPRSEPPEAIMDEAERGFGSFDAYRRVTDRRSAIHSALDEARAGDIVVIAGKGHEDYQILNDRTIHFSDREVVLEWRAARGGGQPPAAEA
ncbi:MAG: UDP-N-acetylmuramoyl-L-alanyl-D-glutamate--2,6-diaminopimelate ligase [Acidobacteriota bacterium]